MKAVIILGLAILILITGFVVLERIKAPEKEKTEEGISFEEKELIEMWIIENDLNQYADPKDTVYMGGTPLFDEKTGETIDKYEYILQQHPQKPWRK